MVKEEYTTAVEARPKGQADISFLSKTRDQVHGHAKVVQWYDASHRRPIAPECSTQDIHTVNRIGSEPCPSREVGLGDNVKPFDVCEIEWACCWNLPDGMKDNADLSHKKASQVHQQREPCVEEQGNLPSNPGGGRSGPPSPFTEKMAVSHRPVGHSWLGGDANNLRGGGGVGRYPPLA